VAHRRMDWDEIANEDGTPPIRRQPARLAGLLGAASGPAARPGAQGLHA